LRLFLYYFEWQANAQELSECLEQLQVLSQRRSEEEAKSRTTLYQDLQAKYRVSVSARCVEI
jgi:hypothetical protein